MLKLNYQSHSKEEEHDPSPSVASEDVQTDGTVDSHSETEMNTDIVTESEEEIALNLDATARPHALFQPWYLHATSSTTFARIMHGQKALGGSKE